MNRLFLICIPFIFFACAGPYHGPDKQFAGTMRGAVGGAGAGAVTGFQVGAGTGPGALVGAGMGAVAGGIYGAAQDDTEETMLSLSAQTKQEREVSYAQDILSDHYKRRMELHPTRDIFPADLFFENDSVKLRPSARGLVREIVQLNKNRLPWSRLVIASYVKSKDEKSKFAKNLAEKRAEELGDYFVRYGIDSRRIEARAVIVNEALLIDPHDDPARYNQAIELIPADR